MKKIDITGMKFGRLTVIGFSHKKKIPCGTFKSYWNCECECGTKKVVSGPELRYGKSKSCGCWKAELVGNSRRTHGKTRTPMYILYRGMIGRCTYPSIKSYPDYGGRGIKVCERWLGDNGFANFLSDMGDRPSKNHSIERKNSNGNYCPENCIWELTARQSWNKRNNRILTARGESRCIAEWCKILGISQGLVSCRLRLGWSDEDALFRTVGKNGRKRTSSP